MESYWKLFWVPIPRADDEDLLPMPLLRAWPGANDIANSQVGTESETDLIQVEWSSDGPHFLYVKLFDLDSVSSATNRWLSDTATRERGTH